MHSASPFSVLDRMKPGNAATRMRAAAGTATGRASLRAGDRTAGAGPERSQAARAVRSGETTGHRGGFSDTVTRSDRNDTGHLAPGAARAFPGEAPGVSRHAPPGSHTPGGADANTRAGRAETHDGSLAETVVAAGLSGLGALARTPAQRLALSLAQSTYAALHTRA